MPVRPPLAATDRPAVLALAALVFVASIIARPPAAEARAKRPKRGAATATLVGTVRERGTRKPLADVTVYLKNTPREALTNKAGYFSIPSLPPGRYELVVPSIGHETFTRVVQLTPGRRRHLLCTLEPKVYGGLEVVVRHKRLHAEVTKQVIDKRELVLIAGGQGDAVRAVENLPGVLRGSTFDGVAIRGSGPEDSAIMLDGHRIPLLFHFGGFKAVYNSELLSDVNLITGGQGVRWGNATGGVVELQTRAPRRDRWGGHIDASLLDASALAEGPLSSTMGVAVAFRRSTVDAILPLMIDSDDFRFTALPVYYDYQAKWCYAPNRRNTFRIDAYGAFDNMSLSSEVVDDRDPEFSGGFDLTLMFHSVVARHTYSGNTLQIDTSLGYSNLFSDWGIGVQFVRSTTNAITLRQDARLRLGTIQTLLLGLQARTSVVDFTGDIPRPPKEGDPNWSSADAERLVFDRSSGPDLLASAYIADELVVGPVTLIPGIRVDYSSALDGAVASPNVRAKVRLHRRLTLKTAIGLYHQLPQPDERIAPAGNPGLTFERAIHATGGAELRIADAVELQVQAYYKVLQKMVRRIQPPTSVPYDNAGKGRAFGGEVLLRHRWSRRFFGWVSYAFSRSLRNDGPGSPFRLFDMDQTHNVVALLSWEFARGWRFGARFQYTTGEPYTNIYASAFQADSGTYQPIYDPRVKNTRRRPAFHRMDLRIDKQWVFRDWMLHAYLDVQNVYYHENPVDVVHNYDYSEYAYFKSLPIFPSIGVKGQF